METTFAPVGQLDALTPQQAAQARLSLRRGGARLRSLHARREAAWLGSWLTTLPRARAFCPEGWASKEELSRDEAWAREGWAHALRDATDSLAACGVYLDGQGEASYHPPEADWAWEDGFAPLRKRQRALSQTLEERALAQLLSDPAVPREAKARVRSCGGPGAGAWLGAIPADEGLSFSDEEFATALRFCLGQDLCLEGQRCGNTYSTTGAGHVVGGRCPKRLDAAGHHAAATSTAPVGLHGKGDQAPRHPGRVRSVPRVLCRRHRPRRVPRLQRRRGAVGRRARVRDHHVEVGHRSVGGRLHPQVQHGLSPYPPPVSAAAPPVPAGDVLLAEDVVARPGELLCYSGCRQLRSPFKLPLEPENRRGIL